MTKETHSSPFDLEATRLRQGWLAVSLGVLAAACMVSLFVGPVSLNPLRILAEVADRVFPGEFDSGLTDIQAAIVIDIRLPRVIMGVLVGGMLALSGAAYQGIFRNPLADPYLLGIASGAGFGATLAIVSGLSGDNWILPGIAFIGGLAAAAVSYIVGTAGSKSGQSRLDSTASLILAGVAIASFFTAIQTYLQQRHTETIREVYSWILGRLSVQGWEEVWVLLPYVVIASAAILAHGRVLDVFEVGDEEAVSLGINVRRRRLIILIAASLGASATVALSGLIGFVGIVVPHVVRLVLGNSYRIILPLSLILGAAFVVFSDLAARVILEPSEIPIGVITAFLGTPFFVFVLYRARRTSF